MRGEVALMRGDVVLMRGKVVLMRGNVALLGGILRFAQNATAYWRLPFPVGGNRRSFMLCRSQGPPWQMGG
jgi:hypothetical protein